jgi:uncharacterized membrane protein YGL010W
VAGIVPILGSIVIVVSAVWTLVAVVVAVRQALDYRSTGRAIGVCVIGWVVQIVIFGLFIGVLRRAW